MSTAEPFKAVTLRAACLSTPANY